MVVKLDISQWLRDTTIDYTVNDAPDVCDFRFFISFFALFSTFTKRKSNLNDKEAIFTLKNKIFFEYFKIFRFFQISGRFFFLFLRLSLPLLFLSTLHPNPPIPPQVSYCRILLY